MEEERVARWCVRCGVDLEEDRRRRPLDVSGLAKAGHSDGTIVWRDVERAVWRLGPARSWPSKVRKKRRAALCRVIDATFAELAGRVSYYQGFHEVAEVLMHVVGFHRERDAVVLCERFATRFFCDATSATLDGVAAALRLLVPLVSTMRPDLGAALFRPDDPANDVIRDPPIWALSWIVTWFAHDVDDLEVVTLLWDNLLEASHPAFVLYLSAALVAETYVALVGDDDWPAAYARLAKLPETASRVDWTKALDRAWRAFRRDPPDRLLRTAHRVVPRALRPPLLDLQAKCLPSFRYQTPALPVAMLSRDGAFPNPRKEEGDTGKKTPDASLVVNVVTPEHRKKTRRRRKRRPPRTKAATTAVVLLGTSTGGVSRQQKTHRLPFLIPLAQRLRPPASRNGFIVIGLLAALIGGGDFVFDRPYLNMGASFLRESLFFRR
mmetsp:Transcript_33156/g.105836  ORF Transcript_33156/g.105836 Transcript_33156/m.105836 type:complete len:438 (+) Transcript_33156:40-1353(+)